MSASQTAAADRSDLDVLAMYELGSLIGPGATGVVFSGRQRLSRRLDADRRVALKVVRHRFLDQARAEAAKLMGLDQIRGVVNILHYFEVPYSYVRERLEVNPLVAHIFEDEREKESVGILVLQFIAGLPLVSQIAPHDPLTQTNDDDYLIVRDTETKAWFREKLRFKWSIAERLDVLIQITRHIAACHEMGTFHGDLKPLNILYDAGLREIKIVDFQGGISGSPGWQAPEHLVGDPPGPPVDIFIIGVFLTRFFSNESNKLLPDLANRCLKIKPRDRPSAREVLEKLIHIERRHTHPKWGIYTKSLALISVLLLGLLAFGFFRVTRLQRTPTLKDRFAFDVGAAHIENLVTNHRGLQMRHAGTRSIGSLLEQNRLEEWSEAFKKNLVRGMAELRAENTTPLKELPKRINSVTAIWFEPKGNEYFLWQNNWYSLGDWLSPNYYFDGLVIPQNLHEWEADPRLRIRVASLDGEIRFVDFRPILIRGDYWIFNGSAKIFFSDCKLSVFLFLLAEKEGREVSFGSVPAVDATLNGVLTYTDRTLFTDMLSGLLPYEISEGEIKYTSGGDEAYDLCNISYLEHTGRLLTDFVDWLDLRYEYFLDKNSLPLIENKRYTYWHRDTKNCPPWQVVFREVLTQHQLDFRVDRVGKITIFPIE